MTVRKEFTCPYCDSYIEIEDVSNTDMTDCHGCGRNFQVEYEEAVEEWRLRPVEEVEREARENREEPFGVLREQGALKEEDQQTGD